LASPVPLAAPAGDRLVRVQGGGRVVLHDSKDTEEIIERVAALDIGKAELVACIRVPNPDQPDRRAQGACQTGCVTRSS
jgi:transposase